MNNQKKVEWVLRIAIAGEFVGHGVFALQGKAQWVGWISQMIGVQADTAVQLLSLIGFLDLLVALMVLVKPIPVVLLWAAFWGFWTALVRPLVNEPIWDFIERSANWGAPLALLFIYGYPKNLKGWFSLRSH